MNQAINDNPYVKLRGKLKGYVKATFDLHDVDEDAVADVLEELAEEARRGEYSGSNK